MTSTRKSNRNRRRRQRNKRKKGQDRPVMGSAASISRGKMSASRALQPGGIGSLLRTWDLKQIRQRVTFGMMAQSVASNQLWRVGPNSRLVEEAELPSKLHIAKAPVALEPDVCLSIGWSALLSRVPRRYVRDDTVFRVVAARLTGEKAVTCKLSYRHDLRGQEKQSTVSLDRGETHLLGGVSPKEFQLQSTLTGTVEFLLAVFYNEGFPVREFSDNNEYDLPIVFAFHYMKARQLDGLIFLTTQARVTELIAPRRLTIKLDPGREAALRRRIKASHVVAEAKDDEERQLGIIEQDQLVEHNLIQAIATVPRDEQLVVDVAAVISVRQVTNEQSQKVYVHRIYTATRTVLPLLVTAESQSLSLADLVNLKGLRIRFV